MMLARYSRLTISTTIDRYSMLRLMDLLYTFKPAAAMTVTKANVTVESR